MQPSVFQVEVEEHEDIRSGYKIKLYFEEENPYFENTVICKEFWTTQSAHDLRSGIAEIRWKDGKHSALTDDDLNSRKRDHKSRTFFLWLTSQSNPATDRLAEVRNAGLLHTRV